METADNPEVKPLLDRVRQGDRAALDRLLAEHRDFLRRVVDLRMESSLRTRIDPSDVVQEALVEAARRMADYLAREPMPFHLWLRQTACQRLVDLRRLHRGAECRSVLRDRRLPATSSLLLAHAVLSGSLPPDKKLDKKELAELVQQCLDMLDEEDSEIILLRSFEDLPNHEAAQVLGIEPAAASKRYGRALLRLRGHLIARGVAH
jgi:RNA polymerase sigma-70 factor (ECF subfamily)